MPLERHRRPDLGRTRVEVRIGRHNAVNTCPNQRFRMRLGAYRNLRPALWLLVLPACGCPTFAVQTPCRLVPCVVRPININTSPAPLPPPPRRALAGLSRTTQQRASTKAARLPRLVAFPGPGCRAEGAQQRSTPPLAFFLFSFLFPRPWAGAVLAINQHDRPSHKRPESRPGERSPGGTAPPCPLGLAARGFRVASLPLRGETNNLSTYSLSLSRKPARDWGQPQSGFYRAFFWYLFLSLPFLPPCICADRTMRRR